MKFRESYPDQFFTPSNRKKLEVRIAEEMTGMHGKDLEIADLLDWAGEYTGNLDKVFRSESGLEIKKLVAHGDFESAAKMAVEHLNKMDEERERGLAKFKKLENKKENLSDAA